MDLLMKISAHLVLDLKRIASSEPEPEPYIVAPNSSRTSPNTTHFSSRYLVRINSLICLLSGRSQVRNHFPKHLEKTASIQFTQAQNDVRNA